MREEEIAQLKKKLSELKYKEMESLERKRLKQEIWKFEHKGIRRIAGIITGTTKKLGRETLNLFKTIGKKANEYDKKIETQKINTQNINKPAKLNITMEELNYLP